jgi:hypothetical protein
MRKAGDISNLPLRLEENETKIIPKGYPLYPDGEDIYNKFHKDENLDPEDISKNKESKKPDKLGINNEKDFNDDVSGSDLDIPGSELDEEQENIGSEDEENHYYSLGGDDHNDLDEDKGE